MESKKKNNKKFPLEILIAIELLIVIAVLILINTFSAY